jgi:D-alanyl-D-alanine dipeptidase
MGKAADMTVRTHSPGRLLCVIAFSVLITCGPAQHSAAQVRDRVAAKDLVEIVRLDTTIHLDIRYATPHNFMGRAMYAQARAFLQRPAAEALLRVHRAMRAKGYGLLVFDGYRPWAVTKKFWDETPPRNRSFVANPKKGSKHNRGCAVDLSLYDLRTGVEVEMPSPYDDFTPKASSSYAGGTDEQRKMRAVLRSAMEAEGFRVEPGEWWHFDHRTWREYPILDIPFEKLTP